MLKIDPSNAELLKKDESLIITVVLLSPAVIAAPEARLCRFEKVQFSNSADAPLYTETIEFELEYEFLNTVLTKRTLVFWVSLVEEAVPTRILVELRSVNNESLITSSLGNSWPNFIKLSVAE
jgi:hypothetical protein